MTDLKYGVHNPNLAQHLNQGRQTLKQSEQQLKDQEKDNQNADTKLADAMARLRGK